MKPDPDVAFMQRALELAERGRGWTYPNPLVGAVLVKDGKILSEGYHARFGGPHAEVEAVKKARARAVGATLYVTLEPCSTHGKTPPCTDLILRSRVADVVIACEDPNPVNRGRGIRQLARRGVRVRVGVLRAEAAEQNEVFFKWAKTGLPFVSLKMAETLDGKIAARSGESRWITSLGARQRVHCLRAVHQAVLVGARTACIDNPQLNVSIRKASQPVRILIDPGLRVPFRNRIFSSEDGKVIVVTTLAAYKRKASVYDRRGIGLLAVGSHHGVLDLKELLLRLGRMGIASLMVEGGGETAAHFLEKRLVDKIYFFIAPKIFGGRDAKTSVEGKGISSLAEAIGVQGLRVEPVGRDLLITGHPKYH